MIGIEEIKNSFLGKCKDKLPCWSTELVRCTLSDKLLLWPLPSLILDFMGWGVGSHQGFNANFMLLSNECKRENSSYMKELTFLSWMRGFIPMVANCLNAMFCLSDYFFILPAKFHFYCEVRILFLYSGYF